MNKEVCPNTTLATNLYNNNDLTEYTHLIRKKRNVSDDPYTYYQSF